MRSSTFGNCTKNPSLYFYVAVLAVFLGICSPFLLSHGMFMDGVVYASVSRNMALGEGQFWFPYYTETLYPVFYENPPLVFWLQSLCFRAFGTSVFVERFYSVFTIILTGFLIVKIWKEITKETVTAWFPLFLFVMFPIITWTAMNNMLENTMTVFVCSAAFFYLAGVRKRKYYFTVISGLLLCLAVLSKGVVACFLWTFPFWIWLFSKKISFRQAVTDTLTLVFFTFIPLVLFYVFSPDAKQFFDNYLSIQLFPSLSGERETVDTRFHILNKLFENIIVTIILLLPLLIVLIAKKKVNLLKKHRRSSFLFFALSLCGILPVMLSLKQSGFYIVPAYPFLVIAFALPFQPFIKNLMEKINTASKGFLIFKIVSFSLLFAVLVFSFSQKNKFARGQEELETVFLCSKYVPQYTTISIEWDIRSRYNFYGYFARYQHISLDPNHAHRYYLHDKSLSSKILDENYIPLLDMENFVLFKRNDIE